MVRGDMVRLVSRCAVVAFAYGLFGLFILVVAYNRFYVAPLWPPAGVAVAALLLWGYETAAGIFLGALVSNLVVSLMFTHGNSHSFLIAAGIAFGNTLSAVVGASLIRRVIGSREPFLKVRHLFLFLVLVGGIATQISSTVGMLTLSGLGVTPWSSFRQHWVTWWLGDFLGIIVATPLIFSWLHEPEPFKLGFRDIVEGIFMLALVSLSGYFVFGIHLPLYSTEAATGLLLLPPLLWAAFRFGFRGVTLSVTILSAIAIFGAITGAGPFAGSNSHQIVMMLQASVGVLVVTALALAVTLRERTLAERKLRDSERLYQSLVDTLPLHIFRKDNDGRFVFANRFFCENMNYTPAQLLGKNDFDLFPKDLAEKYQKDDLFVKENGGVFEVIEDILDASGRSSSVHVLKTQVRDADGTLLGVQGIAMDVTALKNAEDALIRTAQELSRSNEELERFAYLASHDLQEPLRTVSCYCMLLQRQYQGTLDKGAEEYLGFIIDAAKRMQSQICALLDYSRVGRSTKLKPVDCEELLDSVVSDLKVSIAEAHADITKDPMPTIMSDRPLMSALFQNLLANALKFRNSRPPKIHLSAHAEKDNWLFAVEDNGIGIEREYHGKIFQIFQRLHTDERYAGTGVGLAICKKIVEFHGGKIWVESEAGLGAKFCFSIPREPKTHPPTGMERR